MADRALARLRLDGMPVADYVDGSGLDDEATRADPWFVRVGAYPGIGSQLAAPDPLTLWWKG